MINKTYDLRRGWNIMLRMHKVFNSSDYQYACILGWETEVMVSPGFLLTHQSTPAHGTQTPLVHIKKHA